MCLPACLPAFAAACMCLSRSLAVPSYGSRAGIPLISAACTCCTTNCSFHQEGRRQGAQGLPQQLANGRTLPSPRARSHRLPPPPHRAPHPRSSTRWWCPPTWAASPRWRTAGAGGPRPSPCATAATSLTTRPPATTSVSLRAASLHSAAAWWCGCACRRTKVLYPCTPAHMRISARDCTCACIHLPCSAGPLLVKGQ